MRTIRLVFGFLFAALVIFIVGLAPGEHFLTASKPDSYVLIGIARFAAHVTGFCEFVLGGVLVASWCLLFRKRSNPGGGAPNKSLQATAAAPASCD